MQSIFFSYIYKSILNQMMNHIYYWLGYDEEIEADERQKHLKHLALKQIKDSKIKLKSCNCNDKHPGECVYLGTIQERIKAFKENLPVVKPKLVRQNGVYKKTSSAEDVAR